MKNRFLQMAGALALLAVVAKFNALPLLAQKVQSVATMIQDRDSPARNAYHTSMLSCGYTAHMCLIDLPPVPAGKKLVIEHFSGFVLVGASNSLQRVTLWSKGSTPMVYMPFQPGVPTSNNMWESAFGQRVFAEFDAGQVPTVEVITNDQNSFTAQVALTGYTVDVP